METMKKLLIYISLLFFIVSGALAQQPVPAEKQQQTPDDRLHKEQYKFNGAWLPDHDAAEIGPTNFKTLQNMRYGPNHPVGVSGYTKINTTALSTYTKIRSGHQIRPDRTQNTYVLVEAQDVSGNAKVYQNQTAIPSQGDFEATELHTAATGAGLGHFSDAPQGNVAYCNEKESYIWGGDEIRVGAFFTLTSTLGSELITPIQNRDFSVASDWTNVDIDAYSETGLLTLEANATGQYCTLATTYAPMTAGTLYRISFGVTEVQYGSLNIDWAVKDVGDNDTIATITTEGTHSIDYVPTVAGGFRIESNATDSEANFDDFSLQEISYTNPIDYTEQANNTLATAENTIPIGDQKLWIVFTTRPVKSIKYVIETANDTTSTMDCKVWTGIHFANVSNPSDGTTSGGIALAQSGEFTFDSTVSTAKPYHLEGIYLYAYLFELTAGTAEISHVSVNAPWQPIVDVWDGVLRQPIQFQVESADEFENYTNEVNYQSDIDIPIGGILDGLLTTDNIVVMFDERTTGIRFEMLAGLINENAAEVTVKYNTGAAWVTVGASLRDETENVDATIGKTGLLSWSPPDVEDEHPVTLFGVTGYAYQITFSATLSGVKADADEDILVDLVTGIPAQKTVKAFKFPSEYKNRLLLCAYTEGKEGNRVDYSSSNAPDVFNGLDSSMDGLQSLYFGNTDALTCGTQLYNRYGSNVFATWLALKKNSIYLLTGDTPEDFKIFPVSFTVGCPAPLTLATAEVGFEAVQGVQRNIAFWVSHSGPVMFDGSVLFPIPGIDKYFDPAESVCINHEYIENARGWYDTTFREYNILIPSGSGQETNNVWLAFDLMQKKWYEKSPGIAEIPQSSFTVTDTEGNQYVYAGIDTGYMMRLENGTSWDGTGITYKLATGDFWPSKNIWDKTIIRYLKVVAKRIDEDHTMSVRYYSDTNDQEGVETIWVDTSDTAFVDTTACAWGSASLTTMELSLGTGLYRLVRDTIATNMIGWTHGFEFQVTTTETLKAAELIGWGVKWQYIRDDL